MARLTSGFWVEAYIRQCRNRGAFAYLARRGAEQAGAIFVCLRDTAGRFHLFGPAPQILIDDPAETERCFERLLSDAEECDVQHRLEKEARFDPDFWVVEVEGLGDDPLLNTVTP